MALPLGIFTLGTLRPEDSGAVGKSTALQHLLK